MRGKTAPLTSSGFTSGTVLRETLANGPTTGGAFFLLGDTSPTWAGHTLPTRTGLGFFAPGCFLNINMLLFGPTANPIRFKFSINFWTPALAGLRFRTQWAVDDGGVFRTSNGLDHSFPYARLGTNVWPAGWSTRPASAPRHLAPALSSSAAS